MNEMVDGLLGLMPVGCRNVTYISKEGMEELQSNPSKQIGELTGTVSWHHGPYLDDWSKVPPEIAAKYNTSPTYGK